MCFKEQTKAYLGWERVLVRLWPVEAEAETHSWTGSKRVKEFHKVTKVDSVRSRPAARSLLPMQPKRRERRVGMVFSILCLLLNRLSSFVSTATLGSHRVI